MTDHISVSAEIVEMQRTCSLDEICALCQVDADWIVSLVEHGILEPFGKKRTEWTFAELSVLRVRKARRLERDLGLNIAGIALALDLLDEIDSLRRRLKDYEHRDRR